VTLTATVGAPIDRSELKQGAGEWIMIEILLALVTATLPLHVQRR
jgi:hypothetical protein